VSSCTPLGVHCTHSLATADNIVHRTTMQSTTVNLPSRVLPSFMLYALLAWQGYMHVTCCVFDHSCARHEQLHYTSPTQASPCAPAPSWSISMATSCTCTTESQVTTEVISLQAGLSCTHSCMTSALSALTRSLKICRLVRSHSARGHTPPCKCMTSALSALTRSLKICRLVRSHSARGHTPPCK
jgi:hypothetical protein